MPALVSAAEHLSTKYISDRSSVSVLSYFDKETLAACHAAIDELKAGKLTKSQARQIFKPLQAIAPARL